MVKHQKMTMPVNKKNLLRPKKKLMPAINHQMKQNNTSIIPKQDSYLLNCKNICVESIRVIGIGWPTVSDAMDKLENAADLW
jgi:hypothetical protein